MSWCVRIGGAANTTRPTPEELKRAREENARIEQAASEREGKKDVGDKVRGLADKGKEMVTKGSKQSEKGKDKGKERE